LSLLSWFCVYSLLAVIVTWPLALSLTRALPGDPAGDTGVYVWNLWVFRHELIAHAHWPVSTSHVFAFTGGADFSLHNYTPIAGLMAIPLIPAVGVVGAFNLVMLLMLALSGVAAHQLARHLGLRATAAAVAGALFVAMPLVSARETAHLSLVTNAALPLFLLVLLRAIDKPSAGRGLLVGALVAVANYSDAYYGVYCVLMGAFIVTWRFVRVTWARTTGPKRLRTALDVACAIALGTAVLPRLAGLDRLQIGGLVVSGLSRPYSLMLALIVLLLARAALTFRVTIQWHDPDRRLGRLVRTGAMAVATCLVLLMPVLIGIVRRIALGRLPHTATFWRSSPRGVDLLSYVVPNPVHAIFGRWTERWLLPPQPDAFPELVASCSIVAIGLLVVTAWRHRLPRLWVAFTAFFAALSLGPFIHIGGANTYLIGPWALLRYVPLVGLARSPSRFAIVAALGLSVLAGFAVQHWMAQQRRTVNATVALALLLVAFEVVPGPRRLFPADAPEVYRLVAVDDNEDGTLLELPGGIRDGTSSVGDFSASTAFFQTFHRRRLIGGYLSRVSDWRRRESLASPTLNALYALSERGGQVDAELAGAARASAGQFVEDACVKFVLIDKRRASPELQAFAREALPLALTHEDERYDLLTSPEGLRCQPFDGRAGSPSRSTVRMIR
jgi:hypothetical protein